MAITKKIIQNQLSKVNTLIDAYYLFERTDETTAGAIADRLYYEVDLLISGAIDWIRRYKNNANAIEILKNLDSELREHSDVPALVLNIADRSINFIESFMFNKNA